MSIVIQGREICSADKGKFLKVINTASGTYLPVGFEAKILHLCGDSITLEDTGGSGSVYDICEDELDEGQFMFELGKGFSSPKPKVKTSATQRKKLAKAVKEARKALEDAINEAEEVGMTVEGFGQGISFQPPLEQY